MGHSPPKGGFLERMEFIKMNGAEKVYSNTKRDRYYTFDRLHCEVEVFNSRGKHLGAADAITGKIYKKAEIGRKIDV